MFYIYDRK